MRFDDLAGDRQTEPGVLPKTLLRPVSVETIENLFQRIGTDTGTVVVDHDLDFALQSAAGDPDGTIGRRKRAGIVDQVVDDLAEPGIVTGDHKLLRGATFEAQRD